MMDSAEEGHDQVTQQVDQKGEQIVHRVRVLLAGAILALFGAMFPATVAAQTDSGDIWVCVRIYEDSTGQKDNWQICSSTISGAHNANLVGDTANLHNGCDSQYYPLGGGDWNDCVDYVVYTGMPSNQKLVLYWSSSYGQRLMCFDRDGSGSYRVLPGDELSSWRVEGGNC